MSLDRFGSREDRCGGFDIKPSSYLVPVEGSCTPDHLDGLPVVTMEWEPHSALVQKQMQTKLHLALQLKYGAAAISSACNRIDRNSPLGSKNSSTRF